MQEAARYIDKLQNNLICHIRTHGYPEKIRKKAGTGAQDGDSIKKTVEAYIVNNKWKSK